MSKVPKKSRRVTEPDEFEKELTLLMLVLKRLPQEVQLCSARRICIEVAMAMGNNPPEMLGILEAAKLELWQIAMDIEDSMCDEESDE